MDAASLQHFPRAPFACALGADRLFLLLKTGQREIARAGVLVGDRYAPTREDRAYALHHVGSDGVHDYLSCVVPAPTRRIRYLFCLEGGANSGWFGEGGLSRSRKEAGVFQLPYLAYPAEPVQWLRGATVYEIFPDRFCNGDFSNDPKRYRRAWGSKPRRGSWSAGGDLEGIRQKLTYLQDLGIGAFYTTPLFRSPSSHKYDTADYTRVDPAFGSNQALVDLVAEAHQRGIRVILDGVFNHSGSQFFAFRDLCRAGAASRYRSWYRGIEDFPVDPDEPNYETFGRRVVTIPKLNLDDPECREYFLKVVERWTRQANLDGWRLDVANELPARFCRDLRETVKTLRPEAWILGEVWHEALPWLEGDQFDSTMNYPWRHAVIEFLSGRWDAGLLDRRLTALRFAYPPVAAGQVLNLVGSHDTARVQTLIESPRLARLAAVLLFTAPGVPMVYYGDEAGMQGGPDPDCRRCMDWTGKTRDRLTLALYRSLIRLRRNHPWLNDGEYETVRADGRVLVFLRHPKSIYDRLAEEPIQPANLPPALRKRAGTDREVRRPAADPSLWVAVNASNRPIELDLPSSARVTEAFTGRRVRLGRVSLPENSFRMLFVAG